MSDKNKLISNRETKSSAFTALFHEPENAAQLFEALAPGEKISPGDIHFTTLEGVLFLARKNDLAFTVNNKVLVISEHQSTINQNMPLRSAIYYGRTLEQMIAPKSLYRVRQIHIPIPEFYVFYNGNASYPPEHILKLSDAYLDKSTPPMLDLSVKVININFPENHPILANCQPLYEYSWFIEHIKEYLRSGSNRDEAIILAIQDCIKADIMENFLAKHGSEVINMLFTEFNMEDALAVRFEEGVEQGVEQGVQQGVKQGKLLLLKELALKKHSQGKPIQEIAEELETSVDVIQELLK